MDQHAVIYTSYAGHPEKLADMVLTPTELRITTVPQAAHLPGPSMLHDLARQTTYVWKRDGISALPPQLEALLPPRDPSNPMRRLLTRMMNDEGIEHRGLPIIEQEWLLLLYGGRFNPMGHLTIYPDDLAAMTPPRSLMDNRMNEQDLSALWYSFRDGVINSSDEEKAVALAESIGPTPGVSGMIPKYVTRMHLNGEPADVLIKIEPEHYPRVLALEALALDLHEKAGLDVPRRKYIEVEHKGVIMPLLIVERFDRPFGRVLPQESFYSILRTGSPNKFHERTDGSAETLFSVVDLPGLCANPVKDRQDLFLRLVLALVTGNGDLHTENLSLVGRAGEARLSPVYDPAPMRAYRYFRQNHDLLSALPFDGVGGVRNEYAASNPAYASSGETPPELRRHLLELAQHVRIPKRVAEELIQLALDVSRDFAMQAEAILLTAPEQDRKAKRPDVVGFIATLKEIGRALR